MKKRKYTGRICCLKTGGELMTINDHLSNIQNTKNVAECVWFTEKGEFMTRLFYIEELNFFKKEKR